MSIEQAQSICRTKSIPVILTNYETAMQVYPHGSTDSLPYCTMGSGSLNAMAVFEDGFKEDMGVEDAKKLVARAIRSGIYNDLGSGSNVDLCIIYKDKVGSSPVPFCYPVRQHFAAHAAAASSESLTSYISLGFTYKGLSALGFVPPRQHRLKSRGLTWQLSRYLACGLRCGVVSHDCDFSTSGP